MPYRPYPPPTPAQLLLDPVRDLPPDHLARLVEQVVEAAVVPPPRPPGKGQPPYDPRLPIKVLVYAYATGIRSSREMERLCEESLPYLFLTRGDTPSYGTLCSVRRDETERIEQVFVGLFAVAETLGMRRVGRLVIDSSKLRANASPEAVLTADEYEPVRKELERILAEAEIVDEREGREGRPGATRLGTTVAPDQMRDILRRVRRGRAGPRGHPSDPPPSTAAGEATATVLADRDPDEPPASVADPPPTAATGQAEKDTAASDAAAPVLSHRMWQQVLAALAAIAAAEAEGRQHLCLTDPNARMMLEGRDKKVRECHSFEAAVDTGHGADGGLLVVGQRAATGVDNERLEAVVTEALRYEPEGVQAVDADSGYYAGGPVARLGQQGIDLCVPDSQTAADLHRGQPVGTQRARQQGQVPLVYEAATNRYRCPEGNELALDKTETRHGQRVRTYRAVRECVGCPRAGECLTQPHARRRNLKVAQEQERLERERQRFHDPAHRQRYRERGAWIEGVFGFLRGVLGYTRWLLRGSGRVDAEARLFKAAYQVRKVHRRWAVAGVGA